MGLLENFKVQQGVKKRAAFLSKECNIPKDEIEYFLAGKNRLSMESIRKIADTFYVDLMWLLGK